MTKTAPRSFHLLLNSVKMTTKDYALWNKTNSSTNSTSSTSQGSSSPSVAKIIEGTALVIVIFTSLVLNFSVAFVIWRNKNLRRRTTNIFILNLVISNALMSVFVMPFSFYALLKQAWILGETLCKVRKLVLLS